VPSEDNTTGFEENTNPTTDNKKVVEDTKTPVEDNKSTPISTPSNDALTAGKFYLVYGSFSSETLAKKASKPLENKGLVTKIIPLPSKGLFRVVIGDFSSHEDASSKKAELGSEFSQTWVLKAQ
jgi:cell division protein FtsN